MSRRPAHLEPGQDEETRDHGRPSSPPPGWRGPTRPPQRNGGRPGSPRPGPGDGNRSAGPGGSTMRWVPWVVLALLAAVFVATSVSGSRSGSVDLTYSRFLKAVEAG